MNKPVTLVLLASSFAFAGCDGDDLDSDTEARRAYLGFDRAIDRSINLGFDGYNAASNANIPDQIGDGDSTGTLTVGGKVDQGASSNKEMDLTLLLVEYSDGITTDPDDEDLEFEVTYDTAEDALPTLGMSLRNIPNGTFTGTLIGDFQISGSIDADATFNLTLSGEVQEDSANAGEVIRTPGTLVITGTVTAGDGTYDVDVTK